MRTTHTVAPMYRGRRKFVGSLLLLLLVAFSFWGGTSGNAARNWFARPGNASAAVASPTVTATLFATITVNTTADDNTVNGNCTLREAIIAANTNAAVDACTAGTAGLDTIRFNVGAGTPSIAVTGAGEIVSNVAGIAFPRSPLNPFAISNWQFHLGAFFRAAKPQPFLFLFQQQLPNQMHAGLYCSKAFGRICSPPHRCKRTLDDVACSQVPPVFARKIVKV